MKEIQNAIFGGGNDIYENASFSLVYGAFWFGMGIVCVGTFWGIRWMLQLDRLVLMYSCYISRYLTFSVLLAVVMLNPGSCEMVKSGEIGN